MILCVQRLVLIIVACGSLGDSLAHAQPTVLPQPLRVSGIATPRQIVSLGAVPEGRIARLYAAEDQLIKAGQILVSLDDAVQAVRVATARTRAEATADVDLARVRMEQTAQELQRLSQLDTGGFATSKELQDARLEAEVGRLQYASATQNQRLAELDYEREQAVLEQYHVRAPFDGYVAQVLKHPGDTVGEREVIVVLVDLSSLDVTVDCPIALAPRVAVGQRVLVQPIDQQWSIRTGEVITASRAADPASQTFRVRIRVPNEDAAWISGLRVQVDFSYDAVLTRAR